MKSYQSFLSLAAILLAAVLAAPTAMALGLGDPAPALEIAQWVKGEQTDLAALKGKRVVLVEFWATWCPPCRASIPHLTELQEKHADVLTLVSITDEPEDTVRPFVEKMGEQMEYRVAIDRESKTAAAYMGAFGESSIPHAFIIDKQGRIAYHGHPLEEEFETALNAVLEDTFDLEAAVAKDKENRAIAGAYAAYFTLANNSENPEDLREAEAALYDALKNQPKALDSVAWEIAMSRGLPVRDLEFAERMIKRARELTKDESASVIDTHARIRFEQGEVAEAIELQKKAIALTKDEFEKMPMAFQLTEFEEAAHKSAENLEAPPAR